AAQLILRGVYSFKQQNNINKKTKNRRKLYPNANRGNGSICADLRSIDTKHNFNRLRYAAIELSMGHLTFQQGRGN
ncbi:hypothetical protein GGR95_003263, partial [Sulfitobacter undariae]